MESIARSRRPFIFIFVYGIHATDFHRFRNSCFITKNTPLLQMLVRMGSSLRFAAMFLKAHKFIRF